MKRFKDILSNKAVRIVLVAASLAILVGVIKLVYDRSLPTDEQIAENFQVALAEIVPSKSAIAELEVEGAVCVGCIKEIQAVVAGIEGTEFSFVDTVEGKVQVYFDPDMIDSSDVFIEEITALGFPAKLVSIVNP